ncbi:hypothetical protein P7C71_g855, partial [Lecanoromycetidae sp. Uapishka_2]
MAPTLYPAINGDIPVHEDLVNGDNKPIVLHLGEPITYNRTLHARLESQCILYTNGAGASTESVADMALFHILSVFRQMAWTTQAARSGDPLQFQAAHTQVPALSHNPRGHTLGIIGFGNIGFAIAKKVRKALEMEIIYTDIERKPVLQEEEVNATFFNSMDTLLAESDCVLIATPARPGGLPLLTAETIYRLRRGSRIVNIARGSLIDENALAEALDTGHISAAALDVHMKEPYVSQRLRTMRNVTVTPHTGGGSMETIMGFERLAMENVLAVFNGEEPLTCVNKRFLRPQPISNGVHVNGHVNGHANGHANGQVNDLVNSSVNRERNIRINGIGDQHVNGEAVVANNANGSC